MTKEQMIETLAYLKNAFPHFQIAKGAVDMWLDLFQEEDYDQTMEAIRQLAKGGEQQYPPNASDIFRELNKLKPSEPHTKPLPPGMWLSSENRSEELEKKYSYTQEELIRSAEATPKNYDFYYRETIDIDKKGKKVPVRRPYVRANPEFLKEYRKNYYKPLSPTEKPKNKLSEIEKAETLEDLVKATAAQIGVKNDEIE